MGEFHRNAPIFNLLEFFIENPNLTSIELSELIGVTKRTIEGTLNVYRKGCYRKNRF